MAAFIRLQTLRIPYSSLGNYGICCLSRNNTRSTTHQFTQTGQIRMLRNHIKVNVNKMSRTIPHCNNTVTGYSKRTCLLSLQQCQIPNLLNIVNSFAGIKSIHTMYRSGHSLNYQMYSNFCSRIHARFRHSHPRQSARTFTQNNKTVMIYILSIAILICGLSYAAVPLYSMFCQATGLGGQATRGHDIDKVETMTKVVNRIITVKFNADTASSMRWNFKPQMTEVKVAPGETALAFYKAKNPTDKPIIGIATYNVIPFEAGQYFNKIQCFCFEEQILNPHEEVDMPVFFYIDPEFAEDPKMENLESMTLSYTFFEAREGLELPQPFTRQNIH